MVVLGLMFFTVFRRFKYLLLCMFIKVVISGGSGVTTDLFSDIPPLADEPGLSADVLNLLLAAGILVYNTIMISI